MTSTKTSSTSAMTLQHLWVPGMTSRSVVAIAVILMCLLTPGESIDCYKCVSINEKTEACEDTFDTGIATVGLIARNCNYGYFKGTHCIKLKGEREDGTRMTVRDCSNEDWGSHCGDIRYVFGNQEQKIYGCLKACDRDGCNSSVAMAASIVMTLLVPCLLTLVRW